MKSVTCFAVVLLTGATASAQQTEVEETAFYEYDVAALKAGDWVEYADPDAMDVVTSRLACTEVEKNVVWIERSVAWIDKATGKREAEVQLLGVSKASNLVLLGYAGKPGEVGRKLRVTERHIMGVSQGGGNPVAGPKIPPEEDRRLSASERATCTVSPAKEEVTVGEEKFQCEKWTLEHTPGSDQKKRVETFWMSDKIPFRRRLDKAGNPMIFHKDLPWEGKWTSNGGILKRASVIGERKFARVLKAFGTDAKPALKTKATEEPEKK
ncbi:MAG: hypothetical protein AAB074_16985 [Planctomycetota bacterium]